MHKKRAKASLSSFFMHLLVNSKGCYHFLKLEDTTKSFDPGVYS